MLAFSNNPHDSTTRYQLSDILKLLLGLPVPTEQVDCRCGNPHTSDGAHQLCCKRSAGRAWKQGHDGVVRAILTHTNPAGLYGRGETTVLDALGRYASGVPSHLGSGKRADALVVGDDQFTVHDRAPSCFGEHKSFLFDVTIAAPINSQSVWSSQTSADQLSSGFLVSAEKLKYDKHEHEYARLDYGFLAFAVSPFCVLGPTLIRYLACLAVRKREQYSALRARHQLAPIDPKWMTQAQAKNLSAMFAHVTEIGRAHV